MWNQGRVAVVNELHAADFVDYSGLPGVPPTSAGLQQFVRGLRSGFPDAHFTIDDLLADGDKVVGRWTMRGTQSGAFGGLAPTGKAVTLNGIDILEIRSGTIRAIWHIADQLGLFQQRGGRPTPVQTGAKPAPQ